MANSIKNFSDTMREVFELRGLTPKKLSELTDIPESHLRAFVSGEFGKLPPLPYVRGYLMKISEILNIDSQELLNLYKKENSLNSDDNERKDHLPVNHFANELRGRKKITISIVVLFALIYGIFWANRFLGIPKIKIINPNDDYAIISTSTIQLSGQADNFFDKLFINNEEIAMDKNGNFKKDYQLQPGINNIEFRLKRFLGRETIVERKIIYKS